MSGCARPLPLEKRFRRTSAPSRRHKEKAGRNCGLIFLEHDATPLLEGKAGPGVADGGFGVQRWWDQGPPPGRVSAGDIYGHWSLTCCVCTGRLTWTTGIRKARAVGRTRFAAGSNTDMANSLRRLQRLHPVDVADSSGGRIASLVPS
jgi:hypothetical protein